MPHAWIKCEKCGQVDKKRPGHVGSKDTPDMRRCECKARRCRECCPTGHGTRSA